MKVMYFLLIFLMFVVCTSPLTIFATGVPKIGVRGGIGTDIDFGLAFGCGVNYMLDVAGSPLELGALLFYSHSIEESSTGFHDYTETTDIIVFGIIANYLIGYKLNRAGIFVLGGFGLGMINLDWEEESPTDESLGELLPGGGSRQTAGGNVAGSVFNLGGGIAFNNGLDIRLEMPVILIFDAPGEASSIVPTFTITAGFRF